MKPFKISLLSGRDVPAIQINTRTPLNGLQKQLQLESVQGAIAVVGGAGEFDAPQFASVRETIQGLMNTLGALATERQLAVVDGGTPYGHMRLLGEACKAHDYQFELVGVVPHGRVTWPNRRPTLEEALQAFLFLIDFDPGAAEERVELDSNHSAFVLVKGQDWGDEASTLADVTYSLAGEGKSTLELLINGGLIARQDVRHFLEIGQGKLLILSGTGRYADELVTSIERGTLPNDQPPALKKALDEGRLHTFPFDGDPAEFRALLEKLGGWQ